MEWKTSRRVEESAKKIAEIKQNVKLYGHAKTMQSKFNSENWRNANTRHDDFYVVTVSLFCDSRCFEISQTNEIENRIGTRHEEQYVIFIMTGFQTCLGFSSFIIIWSVLFVLVYWIFFRFYCSFFHISLMIFRFLSPSFIYLFINLCLSQANALHHRSVCVWLEMRKATETQLTLLVAIFNDVFLVFAFGIRIYVSTDEPIWAVPKRMRNTQWTHRLLDINWKLRVQHFTESAIGVDAVAAAAVVCYAAQYSVPYGDVISFQWLFRFRFVQRKLSFSLSLIPRRCTGLFLSIVTSCMPISTVYHRYFILTFCLVAFSHRSVSLNFSSFTWFMT